MLRVLSLNYEFPPIGGGGGNAHRQILRQFTRFPDLDVTLVTSTVEPQPYVEEYSNNVRIQYLPLSKQDLHYWRRKEVAQYLYTQYRFLAKHLDENEYDLCHVFFGIPSGILAYYLRRYFPYIVSVRGSDVPGYNRRFWIDYYWLTPILGMVYSRAARVVSNSEGLRELFGKTYPRIPATVIPNGIDTEFYYPTEKPETDCVSLVCVARLIPRKGIDLLLQACSHLQKAGIDWDCSIIGEGPEEANLKRLASDLGIQERILFHGRLDPEEIAATLPICDIFVLPSYAEGMSNAALEAMACGLPLVLTDTGGTKEMLQGNGRVVASGDAEALAETLIELCNNPERRRSMGQKSRELALTLSWENVAQRYYDLYKEIVNRNG